MRIAMGADHGGFKLKEEIKLFVTDLGHDVADFGTNGEDSVDYPDFGIKAAEEVGSGRCKMGILICSTGIGMCIAANKVKGIRAALCHDEFTAEMSRRHNNANVLCLGAKVVSKEKALPLVKLWLSTPFDGDRHSRRVGKIADFENS